MTYTEYLDGTSKAAVNALVVELEDAVRGASERAVAGSLDRIEGALRRLEDGDEILRRDLELAADRLPGQVESLLAGAIAQAGRESSDAQGTRLGEVFTAIQRLDETVVRVSDQVRFHRQADEQQRAELSAAVSQLMALQTEQGVQWQSQVERAIAESGVSSLSQAVSGAAAAEAERFSQLSGWLGHVRETLAELSAHAGRDEQHLHEIQSRQGVAEQAVEVLSGRLGAMAGGMEEALTQFRSLEASQSRGFTEVRQAIEAMDVAQAQRLDHLTQEVGQLKDALAAANARGGFDQLREEAQTRHDAVVRMLDNINGRVIFDVEANNKSLIILEKLRGSARWQSRLAIVVVAAVLLLFAYVFLGSNPTLLPGGNPY